MGEEKKKIKKVDNVVSSVLNLDLEIQKLKTSTGIRNKGLYFGFWLYWQDMLESGKTQDVQKMTIINSHGNHFAVRNPDKWQIYSKGAKMRMSKFAINRLIEEEYVVVDAGELYNKIRKVYTDHIVLENSCNYDYMALFDICSYFVPVFDVAPQVHIQGFKMCGKTKLMTASSLMSFNGTLMTSFTMATVFRYVDEACPTLYIDEADKLMQSKRDGIEELVAMFNAGYKKGSRVPRCDKQNNVQWYDVFGPKVYGSINTIPNDFASRCHKIVMIKAFGSSERAEKALKDNNPIFQEIRDNMYGFALQNWLEIKEMYEELENKTKLKHREWEIWKPILVMAKYISEELYIQMVDFAQMSIENQKAEEDASGGWEVLLIKAMGIIVGRMQYYSIKEIRAVMGELIEEGEPPSSAWIGRAIRKHNITDFRLVRGRSEALLSPQQIFEIAIRNGASLEKGCLTMVSLGEDEKSSTNPTSPT